MCENLLFFHIFGSSWIIIIIILFLVRLPPVGQDLLIREFSRSHTQRRTIVSRNRLDEWSARRRDLYLTAHKNTRNRQSSMPPVGFEPTISADKRLQTYAP